MSDRPHNADEPTETDTVTVLDEVVEKTPWAGSRLHEALVQQSEADGLPVPDAVTTARLVAAFGWPAICVAIVDIIVWRHVKYPRRKSTEERAEKAFRKLMRAARSAILQVGQGQEYATECEYRHITKTNVIGLIALGHGSNVISDHFQWENRLRCRGYDSKSPLEIWEQEELLRAVDWIFSSFVEERAKKGIRRGDYTGTFRLRSYTAAQFRPQVASAFIDTYARYGVVLDISCGWGDRLAGFYCSRARLYIGCDPNRATFEVYLVQALQYEEWLDPRVIPTVERFEVNGYPGFRVTGTKVVTIVCGPAEEMTWDVQVDLVLTSPPYFNTERYADEQGDEASKSQSWRRYQTLEAWQNGFLYPALDRARAALRPGGVTALNIADPTVGSKRFIVCDPLIDHLIGQGMKHQGVVWMAVKGRPSPDAEADGAKAKVAEPVFILTNGEGRAVVAAELPGRVRALIERADTLVAESWPCLIEAGMHLDDNIGDRAFAEAVGLTKKKKERARYYFRAWVAAGSPGGRVAPDVPEEWRKLESIDGVGIDKQIQQRGVRNPRKNRSSVKKPAPANELVTASTPSPQSGLGTPSNASDLIAVVPVDAEPEATSTSLSAVPPGGQVSDAASALLAVLEDSSDPFVAAASIDPIVLTKLLAYLGQTPAEVEVAPEAEDPPPVVPPGRVPALDLRVGDAFDLLARADARSIDAFFTSPPYFLAGFDYGVDAANVFGTEASDDLHVAAQVRALGLMTAGLKDTGIIGVNLADHWSRIGEPGVAGAALGIPERVVASVVAGAVPGLHYIGRITWRKHHPRHQVGVVGRVSTTTETILLFAKSPRGHFFNADGGRTPHLRGTLARIAGAIAAGMSPEAAHRKWGNPLGAFPGDVWNIPADRAVRHGHPCPFPVALAERFFKMFAPPGGTVCDPFVGSGSSGVAAARLGLHFVGCDLNPVFIETARRRWEAESANGTLCRRLETATDRATASSGSHWDEGEQDPLDSEVATPGRLPPRHARTSGSPSGPIRVPNNHAGPRRGRW